MRPGNPARPPSPPDWQRRLVITAIVGSSVLYCLGTGAYALKESLVPGGQATAPVAIGATQTPSPPPQALEPTPTRGLLVFPTALPPTLAPRPTALPETPTPWETPDTWPTATPTELPTATEASPSETPTLEPTATGTPTPTETPTETPDHGRDRPTETPSPRP